MRVLRRLFMVLLMPALGYLLGATIFNYFGDEVEPGDLTTATTTAVVTDCVERGPVSWRGFGYWDRCSVSVESKARGTGGRLVVNGLFEREDIGKKFAVEGIAKRGGLIPQERPYFALGGFLLLPFGGLWIYVLARVGAVVWPDRKPPKRKTPIRYEPPAEPKPKPARGVSVPSGWVFGCELTVGPEGMGWGKKKLTWAEIENVRISTFDVLHIQPRNGKRVRIGPIPGESATRIHVAMGHYGQVPYSRAK